MTSERESSKDDIGNYNRLRPLILSKDFNLCYNKTMDDRDIWFSEYAKIWIEKMDIRGGEIVLDFGAGEGYYTIPLARAVGPEGRVYVYEKDPYAIQKIKREKEKLKLKNIEIVRFKNNRLFPFKGEVFDIILFYDVLHSYYFTEIERKDLLIQAHASLKKSGVLSVFPKHVIEDEFISCARESGFSLVNRFSLTLLHYGFLEKGIILNFKKIDKALPKGRAFGDI